MPELTSDQLSVDIGTKAFYDWTPQVNVMLACKQPLYISILFVEDHNGKHINVIKVILSNQTWK
jgi:hypothetical protein